MERGEPPVSGQLQVLLSFIVYHLPPNYYQALITPVVLCLSLPPPPPYAASTTIGVLFCLFMEVNVIQP